MRDQVCPRFAPVLWALTWAPPMSNIRILKGLRGHPGEEIFFGHTTSACLVVSNEHRIIEPKSLEGRPFYVIHRLSKSFLGWDGGLRGNAGFCRTFLRPRQRQQGFR